MHPNPPFNCHRLRQAVSRSGLCIAMRLAGIILLAGMLTSCSGKPYAVLCTPEPADAMRSHPIFVVSHGWHTGLVIPADILNRSIPELEKRFGDTAYYEIGWGDKGFYQAQEITTGLTLQAMLYSEGAVMHVVAVPGSPDTYFKHSEVISTCITDNQMHSLSDFVSQSFASDPQGRKIALKHGIYGDSQFYAGEGRYYMMNTCNTWTAKGLQSAGVGMGPSLPLTASSLMDIMRTASQHCTAASIPPAEAAQHDHGRQQ